MKLAITRAALENLTIPVYRNDKIILAYKIVHSVRYLNYKSNVILSLEVIFKREFHSNQNIEISRKPL